jgi:hypothetical protein
MKVENSGHDDFVWVIATYECIADLDRSQIADQLNAVDIAESHRDRLEQAASAKFDEKGIDPEEGAQEGRPVLRMHSYDLRGS